MTKQPHDEPPESVASVPDNVIDLAAAKRRFLAATAGIDAATVVQALTDAANAGLDRSKKPLPMLTPPSTPTRFQVRVDLVGSKPPIWRRLDVPSSLTLDRVHDVLQTAFGWTNSHLHRFTLTSDRYGRETEGILTPYDVEEGDEGVLESEVRLDQFLAKKGDTLHYSYDFGDDWEHTITLEAMLPVEATLPVVETVETVETGPTDAVVLCLAGKRQGPPEDVGGIHGYEHLIAVASNRNHPEYGEIVDEIAALNFWNFDDEIDLDAINRGLERTMGADQALEWLRTHQSDTGSSPLGDLIAGVGEEAQRYLAGYLVSARVTEPIEIDEAAAEKATAVIRAFLGHVGDGIPLTGAGYLPPKVVSALMAELDPEKVWFGEANREAQTRPLLALREAATELGLVRKYRGTLLLTKRGAQLCESPQLLWLYLAERLPVERNEHGRDVGLLLLLLVAAGEAGDWSTLGDSLDLLSAIVGWRFEGSGRYGNGGAIYAARSTRHVLEWAGSGMLLPKKLRLGELDSAGAILLARATLVPVLNISQ